jgi:hypothetical protein
MYILPTNDIQKSHHGSHTLDTTTWQIQNAWLTTIPLCRPIEEMKNDYNVFSQGLDVISGH